MYLIVKIILLFIVIVNFLFFYSFINVFAIIPFWFLCGLIDVSRHKSMNTNLLKQYFFGKGCLTFILSPLNLFVDLFSFTNLHTFTVSNFPNDHQREIKEVINIFNKNKNIIQKRFENKEHDRNMLFYKWYGKNLDREIPEFNKNFKYIKTIGVSLFREKTSTSRHFGPMRLTYRILYNFNKVEKPGSYIEADTKINVWKDEPLFIFDDTLIHQSFNQESKERYCAFIDIIRPNYFQALISFLLMIIGFLLKNTRGIFYKNWKMI